jgi:predicted KAP-like P-loop ATPase
MNHQVNPSTDVTSTEQLFHWIETKLHLLSEMHQMSIDQTDFVSRHDMTALMTLLSRKQSLMESLHEVQSQLQPYQSQDPESRVWSSIERRKACQAMIARCDTLVQNLIVMENRSLDNMTLQRELVSAQLQQNIHATAIQQAYHASDVVEEALLESSLSIEG